MGYVVRSQYRLLYIIQLGVGKAVNIYLEDSYSFAFDGVTDRAGEDTIPGSPSLCELAVDLMTALGS